MKVCKALSIALVLGSLAYSASQAAAAEPSQQEHNPAALPEGPAPGSAAAAPSLTLGSKISLDSLGPAIVGEDGSLKRITNWDELSDTEKETAKRRIAERNKERVEAIKQAAMKQQQAQAAAGAAGHRKPASSSSAAAAGPGAAAEGSMDEIDLAYKDVYDYKQLSVEERTKLLEKMGDNGKQAFARRVSKYNNEKRAALTPAEREQQTHTANDVMDRVNPELREKLVQMLRDAKGGHGGGAEEAAQKGSSGRKAHAKNSAEEMKRLYRERRERLEVRDPNAPRPGDNAEGEGSKAETGGSSKLEGVDCEPDVDGSCDQSEGAAAAPGDAAADQHDEL